MARKTDDDVGLRPYTWYKRFIVEGAREHALPEEYIAKLERIDATAAPRLHRDVLQSGYKGTIRYVGQSFTSAYDTLVRHNFVATACKEIQQPKPDKGEFVEPVELSIDDFRRHLQGGLLPDVATGYLGLDFLKLL